ncbi:Rapid ALkalinization Factor (RALF) [Musa troglodytarum]|uniref:Rapid ALkalinization Factor (RALF) n=1 Tax=Musa troglodytarum TaxID=320322 RepID=A0A9E7EGX6_9LILI|nr:Rapid ALkalinization Factor (RALF) [Musa troglodytarum]
MADPFPGFSVKRGLISLALLLFLLLESSTSRQVMVMKKKMPYGGREDGMEMETEMEMSTEENRRLLWAAAGKKYISYEALKGDVVSCTKLGVPYYNCHTFPSANPYNRGCQVISGCGVAARRRNDVKLEVREASSMLPLFSSGCSSFTIITSSSKGCDRSIR